MKQTRIFVLAALLSAVVFTVGCTKNCTAPAKDQAPADAATPAEEATPADAAAPAEAPAEEVAPAEAEALPAELPAESTSTSCGTSVTDTSPTAYAPVADVEAQLVQFVENMKKKAASDDAFEDKQGSIVRDANTVMALAVVLAMHDQPNKYKGAATNVIEAATELTKAADDAAVKAGLAKLEAAMKSTNGKALTWDTPTAKLAQLMKQVPLIDGKLKSGMRRFKKTDEMAGMATTLAVIFQVSTANVSETEDPAKSTEWIKFCLDSRDTAAALAVTLNAADKKASTTHYDKLTQCCDECHTVFHKAALSK